MAVNFLRKALVPIAKKKESVSTGNNQHDLVSKNCYLATLWNAEV